MLRNTHHCTCHWTPNRPTYILVILLPLSFFLRQLKVYWWQWTFLGPRAAVGVMFSLYLSQTLLVEKQWLILTWWVALSLPVYSHKPAGSGLYILCLCSFYNSAILNFLYAVNHFVTARVLLGDLNLRFIIAAAYNLYINLLTKTFDQTRSLSFVISRSHQNRFIGAHCVLMMSHTTGDPQIRNKSNRWCGAVEK